MLHGLTDIDIFFKGWWTLLIIIPSIIGLIKSDSKLWSFIFLVIGITLLLCSQDIISFETIRKLIFPFILVMIGLNIILKDTINKKLSNKIKTLNSDKENLNEYCSTFGSQEANFTGEEFNRSKFRCYFWKC